MLAKIAKVLEYQADYFIIVTFVGLQYVTDYTIAFYLFSSYPAGLWIIKLCSNASNK